MKKCLFFVVMASFALCAEAGVGGMVVNGALKTWDEIAAIALKTSGRTASKEAVSATAKTLKAATEKYGDDVAIAAMKGGAEIAEQTAKNGGRFLSVIKKAGNASPEALRALAQNSDDAMKFTAKYGDDVLKLNSKSPGVFSRGVAVVEKSGVKTPASAIKAIAELPAEDVPRVIGALEKNPQVAREFLAGVEKGGKTFVDKVFALNGKQILAGTLGSAAIVGVIRSTAPRAAEARAVDAQTRIATDAIKNSSEEEKKEFAQEWSNTTNSNRISMTRAVAIGVIALACFAGIALVVFSWLRGKSVHST